MAGGSSTKQVGSRASTRSATINAASGNFGASGNKLGFIRTSGSGKRKSITDPEIRESSRPRMSAGGSAQPSGITNQKGPIPKGGIRGSKLPMRPGNTVIECPSAEAMQGVEHPSEAQLPGDSGTNLKGPGDTRLAEGLGNHAGRDGDGDGALAPNDVPVPGGSCPITMAIANLQNTLGGKMDELRVSLSAKVSHLENQLEKVETMMERRDRQVEELAKKVDMIPVDINRGVATAVARETAAVKEGIDEIRNRQDALERAVAEQVAVHGLGPGPRPRPIPGHIADRSAKYWEARKCAKLSPIEGENEEQMKESVEHFIHNVLRVDRDDFSMESITGIRKVKTFGTAGLANECLAIFTEVERRDFVFSHARNLANQTVQEGRRQCNIRMHVPAHLLECFRTLDKHGHILKLKYEKKGHRLRRHVNFDDDEESLYLDVKTSQDDPWERVYPDYAREQRKKRERLAKAGSRHRRMSTVDGSSEDEDEEPLRDAPGPSRGRGGRGGAQ